MATRLVSILVLAAILMVPSGAVHADGAWLDNPTPMKWTPARSGVPVAPAPSAEPTPGAGPDPQCVQGQRSPETDEDRDVARAGWILIGPYQSGWGVRVILGTSSFDGMCRPWGYQHFVFSDGLFAGTISPMPMDSRADGSSNRATLEGRDRLSATFQRYTATDALCCPSRLTAAVYDIDRSGGWPVLTFTSASTSATGALDRPSQSPDI